MNLRHTLLAFLVLITPVAALAQGAPVSFGSTEHDSSLPVEVTADQLEVNQTDGTAKFTGNVIVGQGLMRLTGAVVDVSYSTAEGSTNDIEVVHATGGVTLFNGIEAAEGEEAVYTLSTGEVIMTGDVVMTQGPNAVAGDRMTMNLNDGTGFVEGRVKVLFQSEDDKKKEPANGADQ